MEHRECNVIFLQALIEKLLNILLSAVYFEIHAPKSGLAEEKEQKRALSQSFYVQLENNASWQSLPVKDRERLITQAVECAHVFQRSSSNVEGRNGYLSLHHHVYKKMNPRKMQALTIIHNYFIKRRDGTAAAERFFGTAPVDVFSWLLENTDYPASPAKKEAGCSKK